MAPLSIIAAAGSKQSAVKPAHSKRQRTKTLNWSGVDWVDFTSQYSKAQITTLVLTTADPAPAPIPEPGTWAAMAIFAGGAAYAGWRRRKSAQVSE